jgi:hypothetical protein
MLIDALRLNLVLGLAAELKSSEGPAAGFSSVFVPVLSGPTRRLPRHGEPPLGRVAAQLLPREVELCGLQRRAAYTLLRGTRKRSDHT